MCHGGLDNEVALCRAGTDVKHALVVEPCAQHAHIVAAAKAVKGLLQTLEHALCQVMAQRVEVGHHISDAAVEFGTLATQVVDVVDHIAVDAAHTLAKHGVGVHQQVKVVDKVLVALPQWAVGREQGHALLYLDGLDRTADGSCHHE